MRNTAKKIRHIRSAKNDLRLDIKRIKNALAQTSRDIKGTVYSRSRDTRDQVADHISDKPFQSLGIAFLSGFIVGVLFRK